MGGLSGIEYRNDYKRGIYENFGSDPNVKPEYSMVKSVYHIREFEVEKMKLFGRLKSQKKALEFDHPKIDLFLSHEWP